MSAPDPRCRYCNGKGETVTYARSGYIGDPDTEFSRCGCTYGPMCERCTQEATVTTPEGLHLCEDHARRTGECINCDGSGYLPRRVGQLSREHCPDCEGSGLTARAVWDAEVDALVARFEGRAS